MTFINCIRPSRVNSESSKAGSEMFLGGDRCTLSSKSERRHFFSFTALSFGSR